MPRFLNVISYVYHNKIIICDRRTTGLETTVLMNHLVIPTVYSKSATQTTCAKLGIGTQDAEAASWTAPRKLCKNPFCRLYICLLIGQWLRELLSGHVSYS